MEIFIFCVGLPVAVILSPFAIGMCVDYRRGQERKRKLALQDARLLDLAEARALRARIAEAKIAEAHNRAEVQGLQIELLALKIGKERKEQGLDAPEFNPTDYPPS